MRHFKVEFTEKEWNCGDGCCSDSWHEMDVYDADNNHVGGKDEVRGFYGECDLDLIEYAKEHIECYLVEDEEEFTVELI